MKEPDDNAYRVRILELLERWKAIESLAARLCSALEGSNLEIFEPEMLNPENISAWLSTLVVEYAETKSLIDELEKEEYTLKLELHERSNPTEPWGSRWFASPVAYLFPKERREEWLGDLYEVNREMLHKGYPRWMVNLINVGRTVILLVSSLSIKLSDLISLGLGRIK